MKLSAILTPERTHYGVLATSKKRILEKTSDFLSLDQPQLESETLFDHLLTREKLGSTGIGYGVAIPHCRVENCSKVTGVLMKLDEAIDFDAIDELPVDLVFALIVPTEASDEHLRILAGLAERFADDNYRNNLREAANSTALYNAATSRDD